MMSNSGDEKKISFSRARGDILMGQSTNPARDTRFRPGQSGNPRGRPRIEHANVISLSEQPLKRSLLKAISQKIKVREGDRVVEMDTGTALIRAAQQTALMGSPYMQHRLIDLGMKLENEQAREREENRSFWAHYKADRNAILHAERAAGLPLSNFLPHPDDIIIHPSGHVQIVGPIDENWQKKMEHSIAMRNLLFLQEAWDYRSQPAPRLSWEKFIGTARLFAMAIDKFLPPRLRLTSVEWMLKEERAFKTSKRELLKLLYQGWRDLGHHHPRGFIFPDRAKGEKVIKFAFAVGNQIITDLERRTSEAEQQEAFVELFAEHGFEDGK